MATTDTRRGTSAGSPRLTPPPPPDAQRLTSRDRMILAVLCAAQFMVALDFSILNVALPTMGADLGFARADLQWAITAFALPSGGLLLLFGRVADLYGRRRLFLAGLVAFTAASLLAALAWNPASLLAGRALQGVAAAVIVPAGMSLLTTTFPEGPQRARALSVSGALMALGFTVGMVLGGVLTDAFGWRSTMALLAAAGAVVTLFAPALLTESRRSGRPRLDVPGAVTITGGLLSVIYALSTAAEHGFGRADVIGALVAGAVLLLLFVWAESRTEQPLVDLRMLRRRTVSWGILGGLAAFSMMSSVIFLATLYLQDVRGMTPMKSGLVFGVIGLAAVAGGIVAPRLVGRFGAARTLVAGLLVQGLFSSVLLLIDESAAGTWLILTAGSLACFGHLFAVVSYGLTVTSGVPDSEQGLATGLVTSAQQVGLTLGIPLLSALSSSRTESLDADGSSASEALLGGLRLGMGADAVVLVTVAALVAVGLADKLRARA
ncbi:MFS transporter [Streptomyces sp. N2-109]|uniref:MFS transporter n=1 Tax=Streptomyces gossypii TaxID=2883101 RepID=A0ABT2JRP0_9ACTN|nr:MFS transporter [Streptomyces gossypii]MCT2590373.1 MFS transporter [Streptomyces gossypii]